MEPHILTQTRCIVIAVFKTTKLSHLADLFVIYQRNKIHIPKINNNY